ncbi:unnamed protein product [Parascedosporium putredinis]|nr:unnamed protein product [Parascedosporium putredinis]CAI7990918.1 unnamed protein product [Parascedosporium putredinis]
MGVFSRRMTTAFNTLWQGSLDPFNATTASLRTLTDGDDPAQVAAANEVDPNDPNSSSSTATTGRVLSYEALNQTFTEAVIIRAIIPADATKTRKTDVYRANHYWIGILIAATVVLELIAIASAAFEFITLAPDVLAYASSMVRDNVFVPQPATGSALHGTERSRLLKDMRVQIADVWPEKEVGYVAFSAVGEGPPWRRLTRDRVYR